MSIETELQHAKPLWSEKSQEGRKIVFSEHDSPDHFAKAYIAGDILRREYKGYGWLVRTFRNQQHKDICMGIQICLGELVEFQGARLGMYLGRYGQLVYNSQTEQSEPDFNGWRDDVPGDFEAKVLRLGGELLERAGLPRTKRPDGTVVTETPEGFAEHLPNRGKKYRIVKSTDEAYHTLKQQIQLGERLERAAKETMSMTPRELEEAVRKT